MALLEPGGQWFSCLVLLLWKVGRRDIKTCYCPPHPPSSPYGPLLVETGRRDFKTSVIVPSSGPLVVETGRRDIKTCYCPPVWSCGGNWKEGFLNLFLSPCLVLLLWKLEGGISKHVIVPPTPHPPHMVLLLWKLEGGISKPPLLSPRLVILLWKLEGGISKPAIVPLSGPVVETGRRDF